MSPSSVRRPFRLAAAALIAASWAGLGAAASAAGPAGSPHVAVELTAQTASVAPGGQVMVALHQRIAPGWHTYWRNPGDAGQPTSLSWSLPAGWRAGDIVWPAPERFLSGPIMNYVYTGEVYLPVPVTASASAPVGGPAALKVSASWLACKDVCIPESAELSLALPVRRGVAAVNPDGGEAVARTVAAAPRPDGLSARYRLDGQTVALTVQGAALRGLPAAQAYFFPYDGTLLDQASPQSAATAPGGLALSLPAGYGFTHGKPPERLAGVLSLGGKAFEIDAAPAADTAPAAGVPPARHATGTPRPAPPPSPAAPGEGGVALRHDASSGGGSGAAAVAGGLAGAAALAFLGGLVLNLMPCVFPILSMKAATLARHGEAPAAARREGLAFLAGVVASLMGLAILLVAARGAGQAVGWGFQLQSPGVVAALALVMLATGLNLSGVFEIGLSLQGVGAQAAARRRGLAGAAFTGVLAVVVAAPCTAPFMAPAIGWALVQPPAAALAVFLALSLGLAAPFTLLSFAPALFRRLPRPGAWMEGFRRVLAFPMYAAAAWLAWVFALQTGADALPALFAAALALAFGAFCWGAAQRSPRPTLGRAGALAGVAGGVLAFVAAAGAANDSATAAAGPAPAGGTSIAVQAWTPQRVAELHAQGRPVFVDFTAAWCVTCQVNERTALADRAVSAAFVRTGTVYLKADWTRPNPEIARTLAAQGRSGVPLYLLYPRAEGAPRVLPQLLTPSGVAAALDAAARS